MKSELSVYDYIEYRKYLRDITIVYKKPGISSSMSSLARRSQNISKAYLSLVMSGRRNLSAEKAANIGKALGLKQKELSYFENLVKFNQSKTLNEKTMLLEQIIALRPKQKKQTLNMQNYRVLENWHCLVIRELVRLKDFKEDSKWITQKLKKRLSEAEAKLAIKTLIESGLLTRDEAGRLTRSDISLQTSDELRSIAIQQYHASCFQLAQNVLQQDSVDQREFASVNKLLTKSQFAIVKEKIKRFRDELLEIFDEEQKEERAVCQINIQLLNLTKTEEV